VAHLTKETQFKQHRTSVVSWAVFLGTVTIVLISLTSVIFPALVVRSASSMAEAEVNAWEAGASAVPLLATNLILLAICLAYFKNKLPEPMIKSIKLLFHFEVSKKVAFIVMVIFLGIYIAASVNELANEETWGDYTRVKDRLDSWEIDQVGSGFEPHVKYFFLSSSVALFDNIRVIPFIASIALIILTYLVTLEISQKRFAGLVAMTILLQSHVFLVYDTTATYDNFWILFYLISLYLIFKAWPLSSVSYILSIPSKALTALFLPMTFFFIYRANIERKKKIRLAISYLIVFGIGIGAVLILNVNLAGNPVEPNNLLFWQGFTSMAFQLRFDGLVLFFLLPLSVGLFIASRKGIAQADSILILIAGILLSAPLLTGFTEITNQPYRFVSLVVFFAIGVGTILSNNAKTQD